MGNTPIFDELWRIFAECPWLEVAAPSAGSAPLAAPIIVTGGAGSGKTTFVGAVSDTHPIHVPTATDFGRITLSPDLVLYLFGTTDPAQAAFRGALGAIVLVNPQRVEDAFPMISYLESCPDVPFIVAFNMFPGEPRDEIGEPREALALAPEVPVTVCDASDRPSSTEALQRLVTHAIARTPPPGQRSAGSPGGG